MCIWKYQYTCTHSRKNICIIYSREKHRFAEQSLDSINHRWTSLQCDNACYHDEINEMFQHAMIPSENHLSAVFNIHRKQFICFIFPPRIVLAWQQTILFFICFCLITFLDVIVYIHGTSEEKESLNLSLVMCPNLMGVVNF